MNIFVTVSSNYGTESIYPACAQSRLFCELARTKTLTRAALATIKKLGYAVTVQQPVVTL